MAALWLPHSKTYVCAHCCVWSGEGQCAAPAALFGCEAAEHKGAPCALCHYSELHSDGFVVQ